MVNEFWDFPNNGRRFTHNIHKYPAKLVPEIVIEILNKYKTPDMKLLFEPYVGSGTTLVEAALKGLNCIGTDLNPLARLIAKVKTTCIDKDCLSDYIEDFTVSLLKSELNILDIDIDIPEDLALTNKFYWFKEKNLKELIIIKDYIDNIEIKDVKDFFLIAFSQTLREVSMTRNSEFKRYRIPKEEIAFHDVDSFPIMEKFLFDNHKQLVLWNNAVNNELKTSIKLYDFNTVISIPENIISSDTVDIVITSPPYGDSSTTVAYGQFSRFSNEWLGFGDAKLIDKKLMGGVSNKEDAYFNIKVLDDSLLKIKEVDEKRYYDIATFYTDYRKSIKNVAKVVKPGGISVYVVGNRTVRGQYLKTDIITKEFFEENGFIHIETIVRNIKKKRLPSTISPLGKSGSKVKTMNKEFIVVMKKV